MASGLSSSCHLPQLRHCIDARADNRTPSQCRSTRQRLKCTLPKSDLLGTPVERLIWRYFPACRRIEAAVDGAATYGVGGLENGTPGVSQGTPEGPRLIDKDIGERRRRIRRLKKIEMTIERMIFDTRFFTLMAVAGALMGSLLCFLKGCWIVWESMRQFWHCILTNHHHTGKVVLLLIEAIDVYLVGTVMLIFGMGLYELFINELEAVGPSNQPALCGSNLFGLFRLRARPKWLQINGLDDLKTKLGHVIVMILLVGMFEKSKKVPVKTGVDLLCFSASILFSAGCLFLLNRMSKEG